MRTLSPQISPASLAELAAWYAQHPIPRVFRALPAPLVEHCAQAAGGDWRRCVLDQDGSVTIYNAPVWKPQ